MSGSYIPSEGLFRPNRTGGKFAITKYLLPAYVLLLVYGTLFPFSGWQVPEVSPWSLMWQYGPLSNSRADSLTNLLIYMPLGLLLMRGIFLPRRPLLALVAVSLVSAALSGLLEYLQAYLPGRVPSVADVALNTAGSLAGALLTLGMRTDTAVGTRLHGVRMRYIHSGPRANLGLLALLLWSLSQLSPLLPSLDLDNLRQGLKPLWHALRDGTAPQGIRVLEYALSFIAVGMIGSTLLLTRHRALLIFAAFGSIVLLLKIPIVSRQLSLEALLGFAIALAGSAWLVEKTSRVRQTIAVCAVLGAVVASGLHVPTNSTGFTPAPFNWIPFRSHMSNSITGLIDIFGDLWPFVALSYLARPAAGQRQPALILAGGVMVFFLVFAIEWYQQYLPGRSPDITDAVIATIAWLVPWFYPAYLRPVSTGMRN